MNEAINQETGEVMLISEITADEILNRSVRLIKSLLPSEWFDTNGYFKPSNVYAIPIRILHGLRIGLGEQSKSAEELAAALCFWKKDDMAKILARYIFHGLFSEAVKAEQFATMKLIHFALSGRKDNRDEYEKLNNFFGYLND